MAATNGMTRRNVLAAAGGIGAAGAFGGLAAAPAHAVPAATARPLIGKAHGDHLHAMTFNIRLDREDATKPGEPDHWPDRAPLVTRLLRIERPTVLGVQEAEYQQLVAVEQGLGPTYRMIGFGRDGGADGEYSSIFYDADRLHLLWWDQYWLSDTPDLIGSRTWGNNVTRIVTWARFRDNVTGREFVHLNSHFDHQSENARVRSAETVRDQIAALDVPAVFTADCNAAAEASAPYDVLVTGGGLQDAWLAGEQLTERIGTFPNYRPPVPNGPRIDWVLATSGVQVISAALNAWTEDGRYPSDHIPVQALLRLA
ncbi:hypothetical protein SUDANB6_00060 [Streptomyces sp. enrichment culture]|uniref:endonuclease/exonuclease/phosphatase family protein n=1 Tax=Streptomyces sp. enrichment culture TaxID=1795815 RepID=UPI003F54F87C